MKIVSVANLRKNISSYLDQVSRGEAFIIKDEKRNIEVAKVLKVDKFDKTAYEKSLESACGVLRNEHTEWKDLKSIQDWLSLSRQSDSREF